MRGLSYQERIDNLSCGCASIGDGPKEVYENVPGDNLINRPVLNGV